MFGENKTTQEIAKGISMSGISLTRVILYFVVYVVLHLLIALKYEQEKKILAVDGCEEQKKKTKLWGYAFRWFPAAYVVIIILTL